MIRIMATNLSAVFLALVLNLRVLSSLNTRTGMDPIQPNEIELHVPLIHYIFSGDLRLSYRVLTSSRSTHALASLIELKSNATFARQNISLSPINTWSIIEFPCALLTPPGVYTVKLLARGDNHPEITSQAVEIRWLENVTWNVSLMPLRIFTDPLLVNVSLHSQTVCPQEEPANLTVVVKLNYRHKKGDGREITSRALQWPFGSVRSPRNSSVLFPCHLLDRVGSYYVTLAVRSPGREDVILGQSRDVSTVHNTADYALLVNGDVRKCRNVTSRGEKGVRVTYRAPACIAGDKIRLYRIPSQPVNLPRKLSDLDQTYLMERSVRSRPRQASFHYPCQIFTAQQDTLGFCWIYSSSSRDGQSKELLETRQCFPFSQDAEKVWRISEKAQWSNWTSWTSCTATCQSGSNSAVRMRKRVCQPRNAGIYRHGCQGASLETKPCNIPQCHGVTEEKSLFNIGSAFIWFPDAKSQAMLADNQTAIVIYQLYETDKTSGFVSFVSTSHQFILYVLPALGGLLLILLGCCIVPAIRQRALKKSRALELNDSPRNRDSRYALISKEDEPATTLPDSQKPKSYDQPSRSGALEMQIFPISMEIKTLDEYETKPERRSAHVPSPLILQRACRARQLKPAESDQRSLSSSHISSRPEASDVDFEYDDFIPEKLADEEELWTPKRLDIKIFATAYEDIVKELNGAREADQASSCVKSAPTDMTH